MPSLNIISIVGDLKPTGSPVSITSVRFMSHDFGRELTWDNDIIGLDPSEPFANIKVVAAPANPKSFTGPPRQISAVVERRPPKLSKSPTDTGVLVNTDPKDKSSKEFKLLFKKGESDSTNLVYKNDPTADKIDMNSPAGVVRVGPTSVATLVRRTDSHGPPTSHNEFRGTNNFMNRGSAYQDGPDKDNERPHPRKFFLSGGVEVMELKIPAQPKVNVDDKTPSDKISVKRPADIFYYSGHGFSNLLSPPGILASVTPNMSPEDLSAAWNANKALGITITCFIIAGCSVVSIHELEDSTTFKNKDRLGVGMRWAKLLSHTSGCVIQICGYWGSGPADDPIGNKVGRLMGQKISALGTVDLADQWMQIHLSLGVFTTAGALSGNTFSFLEKGFLSNSIEKEDINP